MKDAVSTKKAPAALGPYSQGIKTEDMVFVSGQLPLNDEGAFPQGIAAQTQQSLENVKAILESAGSSMEKVVKTTVLLKDMNDFGKMNEVYGKYFVGVCPARSCFEVARLPKDGAIEIEAIATK